MLISGVFTQMDLHTQAHKHIRLQTRGRWTSSVPPAVKANSFCVVVKVSSFLVLFYSLSVKRLHRKKPADETVEQKSRGKGDRKSDCAEMKIGDYRSTGNTGWIFDSAFLWCFPIWKHITLLYWCVKNKQRGEVQCRRRGLLLDRTFKNQQFWMLLGHRRGSVGGVMVKLCFI